MPLARFARIPGTIRRGAIPRRSREHLGREIGHLLRRHRADCPYPFRWDGQEVAPPPFCPRGRLAPWSPPPHTRAMAVGRGARYLHARPARHLQRAEACPAAAVGQDVPPDADRQLKGAYSAMTPEAVARIVSVSYTHLTLPTID